MAMNDLKQKLARLGQDTKNGVQKVSDSVSISNRISAEKKSLGRLYATIGEAVYKESPDEPREGLEDEWAAVKVAYANIASFTEQLNHVKGIIYCPTCKRPASQGDKFCAKCGSRLTPPEETTREKVVTDLKEAGQEVGRIVGDAADVTGEKVGSAAANTKNKLSRLKEGWVSFAKNAGSRFARTAEEEPSGLEKIPTAEELTDSLLSEELTDPLSLEEEREMVEAILPDEEEMSGGSLPEAEEETSGESLPEAEEDPMVLSDEDLKLIEPFRFIDPDPDPDPEQEEGPTSLDELFAEEPENPEEEMPSEDPGLI